MAKGRMSRAEVVSALPCECLAFAFWLVLRRVRKDIMKVRKIEVDKGVAFGDGRLVFIAGPCVIESRAMAVGLASRLKAIAVCFQG